MHYFKKILIWIFVFSYVCTDTVIMAESARQTAGFEAKDFQDRVEMIADQLKATEKTIKKTISDHLYEARLLLNRNRFKKARESVKKAFEAKEAGRKTIENKIRELAAIEARKRAEERIFGETLTKVKEYSFDYDDKAEVPSVDESIESAETLLSDIAYEEENYEIGQKKKREAEARKAMEKELRRHLYRKSPGRACP